MAQGVSDRQANALLNAARVASNVDIANPALLANQLDQRHVTMTMPASAIVTAGATYRVGSFVADRAYKVVSARVIPAAAVALNASNYNSVNVVANNDAGGADTVLASMTTQATSLVAFQSAALAVTANNLVAAGQQVDLVLGFTGTGVTWGVTGNAPLVVDLVVQEV